MEFIKECLAQIKMRLRLDTAIVDKLEEMEGRLYRLEEDNKLLKAHNKIQDEELHRLRLVVQSEGRKMPPRSSAAAAAAPAAPAATGY